MRSAKVQAVAEAMSDHIDAILTLWKPGAKVTVVVRHPDSTEKDFVMGNDTLDGAIEALERSKGRKPG